MAMQGVYIKNKVCTIKSCVTGKGVFLIKSVQKSTPSANIWCVIPLKSEGVLFYTPMGMYYYTHRYVVSDTRWVETHTFPLILQKMCKIPHLFYKSCVLLHTLRV